MTNPLAWPDDDNVEENEEEQFEYDDWGHGDDGTYDNDPNPYEGTYPDDTET